MNKIQDTLADLSRARGIKGCAVVLPDGISVAEALSDRFRDDVVSGLVSFLISTTNKTKSWQVIWGAFTLQPIRNRCCRPCWTALPVKRFGSC